MSGPRSAYVHVPFCAHHCGYCDFSVIAGRDDLVPDYLDALRLELQQAGQRFEVDTLFIGGGTPTRLSPVELNQLMTLLAEYLPQAPGAEVTIEANPFGLTADHVEVFRQNGGNRVSLGVQSFVDSELITLERDHRAEIVEQVVACVKERIDNVSIDLIFGVPGQSLEIWAENLQRAVSLQPQHISCYGLTIEKGTSFWGRVNRGEMEVVPDELQRDMYALNMEYLPQCGFAQYEISNFAQSDQESRHNRVYWSGDSFLAFGPGAARLIEGVRSTNHRSVTTWMKRLLNGQSAVADSEELSAEERACELAMLNLRMCRGVNFDDFKMRTGFDIRQLASDAIREHSNNGWIEVDQVGIRLTHEGRFVADRVMSDFL